METIKEYPLGTKVRYKGEETEIVGIFGESRIVYYSRGWNFNNIDKNYTLSNTIDKAKSFNITTIHSDYLELISLPEESKIKPIKDRWYIADCGSSTQYLIQFDEKTSSIYRAIKWKLKNDSFMNSGGFNNIIREATAQDFIDYNCVEYTPDYLIVKASTQSIPEYVKCIADSKPSYERGIIYRLNLEKSDKHCYYTTFDSKGSTTNGWSSCNFKPSTKEAYDAQNNKVDFTGRYIKALRNNASGTDVIKGKYYKCIDSIGQFVGEQCIKFYPCISSNNFELMPVGFVLPFTPDAAKPYGNYKMSTDPAIERARVLGYPLLDRIEDDVINSMKLPNFVEQSPFQTPVIISKKKNYKFKLITINQ